MTIVTFLFWWFIVGMAANLLAIAFAEFPRKIEITPAWHVGQITTRVIFVALLYQYMHP